MSALVKILSGSHEGAEFLLSTGEYVVGSGDEADLILVDATLRPRHARLIIRDGEWLIEPLDGAALRVGGTPKREATRLEAYQVATLGGVHLALGPDALWPATPLIPASRPETTAKPRENDAGEPEAAGKTEEPAAPPPSRPPSSRAWLLFACLCLLVLLAGAFVVWRGMTATRRADERAAEIMREMGLAVWYPATPREAASLPAGQVAILEDARGRVLVSGLLASRAERAALEAIPELATADFSALLAAEEEIDRAASEFNAATPGLSLASAGRGFVARVEGIAERAGDLTEAVRRARETLDPRIAVRRAAWLWPELATAAEREAARQGMAGVAFNYADGRIGMRATALPTPRQMRDFLIWLEDRYDPYAARLFSDAFTTFIASETDRLQAEETEQTRLQTEKEAERSRKKADEEARAMLAKKAAEEAALQPPTAIPETPSDTEPTAVSADQVRIAEITADGFIDQRGHRFRRGEIVLPGIVLQNVYPGGIVLQKVTETLFMTTGSIIHE